MVQGRRQVAVKVRERAAQRGLQPGVRWWPKVTADACEGAAGQCGNGGHGTASGEQQPLNREEGQAAQERNILNGGLLVPEHREHLPMAQSDITTICDALKTLCTSRACG